MKTRIQGVRQLVLSGLMITTVVLIGDILSARLSEAATYYVAKNGNNRNPGTETQPFLTINKGVSVLNPGDTLYVKNGTYAESLLDKIPSGTSWTNAVAIRAYPGHRPMIKPDFAEMVLRFYGGMGRSCCLIDSYIIIDGFILDGTNVSHYVVKISQSSHHIRLIDVEARNSPKSCIQTNDGSNYNEFIRVKSHDCGSTYFEHNFYLRSSNNLIEYSEAYNSPGTCFKLMGSNNIVRFSLCHDNSQNDTSNSIFGALLQYGTGDEIHNNIFYNLGGGIIFRGMRNAKITNNTFYNMKNFGTFGIPNGIHFSHGQDNNDSNEILSNIIHTGAAYGIRIDSGGNFPPQNNILKNNLIFNTTLSEIFALSGQGTIKSGNITGSDPLLADPANGDFSLLAGSPALKAGIGATFPFNVSLPVGELSAPTDLRVVSP